MRWLIAYDNKKTKDSGLEIVNAETDNKAQDIADYFRDWHEEAGDDIEIRGIFKEVKSWK